MRLRKVSHLGPKKVTEQSIDAIDLPKQETVPLTIPPFVGLLTGAEKTAHIDKALKGASEETIIATLKDQVAKGSSEVVGLIVEATKPGAKHENVKTLSPEQFKEVYDVGMKNASKVADSATPATAKLQGPRLANMQGACSKLATAAGVESGDHIKSAQANMSKLTTKAQQHAR